MATIHKRGDGQWHARIRRRGFPSKSKTFTTKYSAERWARNIETEMVDRTFRDTAKAETTTVKVLLKRYKSEVLDKKGCYSSDPSRLKNITRHLGRYALINLTPERIAQFRNERLMFETSADADEYTANEITEINKREKRVGPASVTREMNILSSILKHAMAEWGIHLPHGNPVSIVKRPKAPRGRDRRTDEHEILQLIQYSCSSQLHDICLFAMETAMRRGEIADMHWGHVDIKRRQLHIPKTKTDTPRTIPLSRTAIDILLRQPLSIGDLVWGIRADSITQAFVRARDKAGIVDLHFHDLRHEAISRFFELGLDHMKVAKITGHKDLRMLERYTHLKPDYLADEIDAAKAARAPHASGNVVALVRDQTYG